MTQERVDQPKQEEVRGRLRLQLDFSPQEHERLQEIRKKADGKTTAEVVRNALRIYEWYLDAKARGARFRVVEGDVTKEVELLLP